MCATQVLWAGEISQNITKIAVNIQAVMGTSVMRVQRLAEPCPVE